MLFCWILHLSADCFRLWIICCVLLCCWVSCLQYGPCLLVCYSVYIYLLFRRSTTIQRQIWTRPFQRRRLPTWSFSTKKRRVKYYILGVLCSVCSKQLFVLLMSDCSQLGFCRQSWHLWCDPLSINKTSIKLCHQVLWQTNLWRNLL